MNNSLENSLQEIDNLKIELNQYRHLQSDKVVKAFEIEYTYESNRIEGNTLTLQETSLVIEKGLTISGKTFQEHLEVVNHTHALDYVKELVIDKTPITETILLNIHQLILQGVDNNNSGAYRKVQVMIAGAKHIPPQPFLVPKQMEDYFLWYLEQKGLLHPVLLAAEMHERLVTIHPFIDGNGRTSRLIMNLILLQHGYPIAILKGDAESRMKYYRALELAQVEQDKNTFLMLVAQSVKETLERVINVLK